jgi:hypothetical protein
MECRMCSESRTNIPAYQPVTDLFLLQVFELITGGDYVFDPASGSRYSKDDDQGLLGIMTLVLSTRKCSPVLSITFLLCKMHSTRTLF